MKKVTTSVFKNLKVVIGNQVLEEAKLGRLKKVVYAKNCSRETLAKIQNLEKLGLKTEKFAGDSESLGIALGKPFPVSVVGVR
jgi:ribosomal protein L30E